METAPERAARIAFTIAQNPLIAAEPDLHPWLLFVVGKDTLDPAIRLQAKELLLGLANHVEPSRVAKRLGPARGVELVASTIPVEEERSASPFEMVDAQAQRAYLETDSTATVAWYEGFGFTARAELEVLGVTIYLMERAPRDA